MNNIGTKQRTFFFSEIRCSFFLSQAVFFFNFVFLSKLIEKILPLEVDDEATPTIGRELILLTFDDIDTNKKDLKIRSNNSIAYVQIS